VLSEFESSGFIEQCQPASLRRYQISRVYRSGVGDNAPLGFFQVSIRTDLRSVLSASVGCTASHGWVGSVYHF